MFCANSVSISSIRTCLHRAQEDGAGVRDQDVDLARSRDGGVHAGLVGDVQPEPLIDRKVVQRLRVSRGGDDSVTASRELGRGGAPDALGRAGDQYRMA